MPLNETNLLSERLNALAKRKPEKPKYRDEISRKPTKDVTKESKFAHFWQGELEIDCGKGSGTNDTFLRLDGWTKGVAFVNEFNLGRYWPVMGPQVCLKFI